MLNFSTIAKIYDGTISEWNDPAIQALNPTLASSLPSSFIQVVVQPAADPISLWLNQVMQLALPGCDLSVPAIFVFIALLLKFQ